MAPKPTWSFKSRRVFVGMQLLSLCLLYFPTGLGWYMGNLVVYLNSYSYARLQTAKFLSQWILSAYLISRSTTMIIVGNVIRKVDPRMFTLIGVLFYNAGLFLSYFTVQYSQMAYISTLGAVTGIGYGFIQTEMLTRMPIIVSKRVGLAIAFINTFMNLGAVLFNWVITWYANGSNREADVPVGGHYVVFGEKSVIDRVPGLFVILGIMTSTCHILGFLLSAFLKDKGPPEKDAGDEEGMKEHAPTVEVLESTSLTSLTRGVRKTDSKPKSRSKEGILSPDSGGKLDIVSANDTGKSVNRSMHFQTSDGHNERHPERAVETLTDDSTSTDGAVNQLQMIKSVSFYILWFGLFATDASYVILLNFYKMFGELWIQDDHFLTHIGMASLVTVIATRMLWALIMDKVGVKHTQIILSASMCLTFAFCFFTPQIDKWLFAVTLCATSALCSAVYVVFPVLTLKLFGQTHFAANYGVITTSTIVLNLIAPQVATTLVQHFGWAAVFLATSALNALSVIAVVVGL